MPEKTEVTIERNRIKEDPDLFVAPAREEEYLKAHNIEHRKLSNGIELISITRQVEDQEYTHFHLDFPSGSYFDPPTKKGFYHLLEHLISRVPGAAAKKNRAEYNASTSVSDVEVYLNGFSNPNVRNFGVWPLIPVVYKQLAHPAETIGNVAEALDSERKVVFEEMNETQSDQPRLANYFLYECVLAKNNPKQIDPLGSRNDLESITVSDVRELSEKIFVPQELIISIFHEGKVETGQTITNEMEELFGRFPRKNARPQIVKRSLFETFNPEFRQGELYTHDTGLKNNITNVDYVWIVPNKEYTISSFALSRYLDHISRRLFDYSRNQGLAYTAHASEFNLGGNVDLVTLSLVASSRSNIVNFAEELLPKLKGNVLATDDNQISQIIDLEHRTQKAIVQPVSTRLGLAFDGIKNYGFIVDADEVKRRYGNIKVEDLKSWREKFLTTDPAIVITGDLSKK